MKTAIYYKKHNGKKPFLDWLNALDTNLKIKVQTKIRKLENNNNSDCSILKDTDGIKEARIHTASGLRIYFAEKDQQIIILLAGGDKDTQKKDIKLAKEYWQEYKQRS
ncbi:MAG: type II toxin-antitoxin system RelE/ParE family toxin [Vampirovibrionia bacterium]